ncbi:MAG: hypothetical protein AAF196_01745 [Planctomycetota bacterium]
MQVLAQGIDTVILAVMAGTAFGLLLFYALSRLYDHLWERVDGTEGREVAQLGAMRFGHDRREESACGGALENAYRRSGRNVALITQDGDRFVLEWRNEDQQVARVVLAREEDVRSWFEWASGVIDSGCARASRRDGRPAELERSAVPLIGREIVTRREEQGRLVLESTDRRAVWLEVLLSSSEEGLRLTEHLRSGTFAAPEVPPPISKEQRHARQLPELEALREHERPTQGDEKLRKMRERFELAERLIADPKG